MAFKYEVYKKSFTNSSDDLLTTFSNRNDFDYIIEELGFGKHKTRIEEDGTMLYYKGRNNAIYVKYVSC